MKQLLQRLDSGSTELVEVPVPRGSGARLLVKTQASVISAGTERMLLEFGRANLFQKARSQPEKVRQVIDKVRTDGLIPTLEAVRSKLDMPIALGYCHAGVVVEVGANAAGFAVGDRVVTNGPHSEYVSVAQTLAAKMPDEVDFDRAAFTPLAAIGLQGLRLASPTLGETVVVYGLGLIGLLTVQLARANGCRVIGIDRNPHRLALAEAFGATALDGTTTDVVAQVLALTGERGADAVLLTLASSSDEPIQQSAEMSRKRGRIVLVGVTGLNLVRDEFFKKELSFTVSCSYGPGRYDPRYEEAAEDYPLAYVRWTEQRNFEAVLGLMATGAVDPRPLITHRFPFCDAPTAYDLLAGEEESLGVVLEYEGVETAPRESGSLRIAEAAAAPQSSVAVGVVGAGNYALRTLLPALRDSGAHLRAIASGGGTSAAIAARKFGFETATADVENLLADDLVNSVFLLTRHNSHAALAVRALRAGKHVFVEKPLALGLLELEEVEAAVRASGRLLMVGFNRRFAPITKDLQDSLSGRAGPLSLIFTINAGAIPRDHWLQNPDVGGGRIVGEACHWIDLARLLVGHSIRDVRVTVAQDSGGRPLDDVAHVMLAFEDGSTAAIHYLSNGARSYPKERVECFFDGKCFTVDNWRRLQTYGVSKSWLNLPRRMDKGHAEEVKAWVRAIRGGGPSPIPLEEIMEVSRWSIRAAELARGRESVER